MVRILPKVTHILWAQLKLKYIYCERLLKLQVQMIDSLNFEPYLQLTEITPI